MRSHVFALLLVLAPYSAWADPPRPTKALSETLTGDAKAAYDAGKLLFGDGDYAGAEIKFKAAYDASGDPRLLWNMAACEKSQRHYARTEALVREYVDKGSAQLTEQDRADAKSLLETIDSFTVKLTMTVNEEGAEVFIDDVSVGKTPLAKPVVVDIGSRKIVVHKEGFKDFEQQIPVGGAATAKLDVKLEPRVHEGKVDVVSQPNAEIFLDGVKVGVGRYTHTVKSGGHTLRVVAPGMRAYQTEVVVSDDESRTIDVPLEHEAVAAPPLTPKLWWPGAETAVSIGAGAKMPSTGGAAFFDARIEIGVKFGAPTELSLFVDLGSINPGPNNCGTTFHGPVATSASDLDVRYAFDSCFYGKSGLQFAVHFTPRSKFDVWTSIDAGFSGTFIQGSQFDPLTSKTTSTDTILPGVEAGARLGLDYRPLMHSPIGETRPPTASRWGVGVFGAFTYTILGQTAPNSGSGNGGSSPPQNNNNHGGNWPWLLFGARTSLTF